MGRIENGITRLLEYFSKDRGLTVAPLSDPPRPEMQVAIIGDIHGRADLLNRLLGKLEDEAPDAQLVFVGDYVDRGPNSRAVLERLQQIERPSVCLLGNHEAMLFEFLDQPVEMGARWLRNGGIATLKSYGIDLPDAPTTEQLHSSVARFSAVLADGTLTWLKARTLFWQSDNLVVSHAGMDPTRPTHEQREQDFLWGHNRFLRDGRTDGLWVAHGHWARDRPSCIAGRINMDTKAWESGRLSAALIETDGGVRFVDTR